MLVFALVSGVAVVVLVTLAMLPLRFPTASDKRVAIAAAASERFFLGALVAPVAAGLHLNAVAVGAVLGLGLSIGPALITKSYPPILGLGLLFGVGTGLVYEWVY